MRIGKTGERNWIFGNLPEKMEVKDTKSGGLTVESIAGETDGAEVPDDRICLRWDVREYQLPLTICVISLFLLFSPFMSSSAIASVFS
ncbi:hypothetical protein CRG98_018265 [Punica granatum]|uniref:Uncharacterized protein n=1 Tax=Punica granatum TaxID=22663 RepID=A0A2I0JZW1_PUNGR|nr:hypothetical protein CRG98_018265 [Punica granatum]